MTQPDVIITEEEPALRVSSLDNRRDQMFLPRHRASTASAGLRNSVPLGHSTIGSSAAVTSLGDEDLLDFADIFAAGESMPLREMAGAEMRRRKLSL